MFMKRLCLIFLTALIVFSGCTTHPRVMGDGLLPGLGKGPREISKDVYLVKIDVQFRKEQTRIIAINEFVRSKGHESYDMELTKKPGFGRKYYSYTVTMPGSIPVEDLSKVKVFDENNTSGAMQLVGVYLIGIPIVAFLFVGTFVFLFSGGRMGPGDL